MSDAGTLLLTLASHLALTGLPGVAATLYAAHRGVRQVPVLLAIGLAVSGITAMLAFWAFYAEPRIGETFAYLVVFGAAVLAAWSLRRRSIDPLLLRRLATPLALWALGSVFLVFLGFLHGGVESPLSTASTRFSAQLPSDNDIPLFFSGWFFEHGHRGTPPVFPGDWLSSDRPPLQIGYVLSQRGLGWDASGLHYQLLGVVLQQLWIVGLWALLVAARVRPLTRALAMVAVLVSDIGIVHGFFVWPKLLPTAMLLAAAALVVTPQWTGVRRDPRAAALVAALLALALLGHGSSLFPIVPLAAIALLRGRPSGRWLAVAAVVGAALMVPWSAYQSFADPPGDRLQKWMLAGVTEVDQRSTSEAILDRYGEVGLGGALHNKGQNFVTMAGGGPALAFAESAVDAARAGDVAAAIREIRTMRFLYLLPSLLLLLIGPLAMAIARRPARGGSAEWSLALTCFALALGGCLFWGLLLFGNTPARTVIHAGALAVPVLATCGAIVGLRAAYPRFASWYVGAVAAATLALYVPSLDPPPGSGYSIVAALLAVAGLAGFAAVALRAGADRAAAE